MAKVDDGLQQAGVGDATLDLPKREEATAAAVVRESSVAAPVERSEVGWSLAVAVADWQRVAEIGVWQAASRCPTVEGASMDRVHR